MPHKQKTKVVILAGGCDFGRCPVAARLPAALWPVAGKPVLERLLTSLADQGAKRVVVCHEGEGSLAESIRADSRLDVKFLNESLPAGTAGSLRNAAGGEACTLFVVLPAAIVCPPKIDALISAHRDGHCDLTVMLNRSAEGGAAAEASGIYVCSPSALEHIPKAGYFDIKEGLVPELLRAGKSVHAVTLPNNAGSFRDRHGYLRALDSYLESNLPLNGDLKISGQTATQTLWCAPGTQIDPSARIHGRVVLMENARVAQGAIVLGPAVIGKNVGIGKNSVVVSSVIWENAKVGSDCEIQRCLIDHGVLVRPNSVLKDKSVAFEPEGTVKHLTRNLSATFAEAAGKAQSAVERMLPDRVQSHKKAILAALGAISVFIAFLWCYRQTMTDILHIWQESDEYSSGLLVPFLALYVLWSRRHKVMECPIEPSIALGLYAFLVAQAFRFFGLFYMYGSAERLSVPLSIGALVLLIFGWQIFRKLFTILLFLCLMLPWPNRIQAAVAIPLQDWATRSAVFCLETMGYEVLKEGNIIHIGESMVAVAEACNGLRMITAFFVISALVVLLVRRAWWEKLIVLASSLPIALLCNTLRLTVTAIAFTVVEGEYWERVFHDFGGYAMMPLALAAVVGELWLLRKLTTVPTKQEAIVITRKRG
jgi:exosortase